MVVCWLLAGIVDNTAASRRKTRARSPPRVNRKRTLRPILVVPSRLVSSHPVPSRFVSSRLDSSRFVSFRFVFPLSARLVEGRPTSSRRIAPTTGTPFSREAATAAASYGGRAKGSGRSSGRSSRSSSSRSTTNTSTRGNRPAEGRASVRAQFYAGREKERERRSDPSWRTKTKEDEMLEAGTKLSPRRNGEGSL